MQLRFAELARREDLLDAVALWRHDEWARHRGESVEDVRAKLREKLRDEGLPRTWVALLGDVPAGTVSLMLASHPFEPGDALFLGDLLVASSWRGRGIGRALCDHAIAHARQAGLGPLHTYTVDREAFFLRLGWMTLSDATIDAHGQRVRTRFMRCPDGSGLHRQFPQLFKR